MKWIFEVSTQKLVDEIGGPQRVTLVGQNGSQHRRDEPSFITVEMDGWDGYLSPSIFVDERIVDDFPPRRPRKRFRVTIESID
jgi:hypothetical protein